MLGNRFIIAEGLEAKSIPTYIHSQVGDEGAKMAGKAVVDCKVSRGEFHTDG